MWFPPVPDRSLGLMIDLQDGSWDSWDATPADIDLRCVSSEQWGGGLSLQYRAGRNEKSAWEGGQCDECSDLKLSVS